MSRSRRHWLGSAVSVTVVLLLVLAGAPVAVASNDEYFPGQWALSRIGAEQAWSVATGVGVTIAIIDTGADLTHPDLVDRIVASADCVGVRPCRSGGGQDDNGHGTIVSGIAAAVSGNGIGVAGAAPGVRLVVAKALDSSGTGRAEDIAAAVDWAVAQGARVINLSVGEDENPGAGGGATLRGAIESAWARGAVPVLASGNSDGASGLSGANNYGALNALVVGATDRNGQVATYSSSIGDAKWGLVAPGGAGTGNRDDNIFSTGLRSRSAYVAAAGTSMAAPHVSATMALLLSQGLSPAAAVARLLATLGSGPCGPGCRGQLNMAAAVGAESIPVSPTTEAVRAPIAVIPVPSRPAPPPRSASPPTTSQVPSPSEGQAVAAEPPPGVVVLPSDPKVEEVTPALPVVPGKSASATPLGFESSPNSATAIISPALRAAAGTLLAMNTFMLTAIGWRRRDVVD